MKSFVLLALSVAACAAENSTPTLSSSADDRKGELARGFLKVNDELVSIEYRIDGDEAIFDNHVRVPKSMVIPADMVQNQTSEALNLTEYVGVKHWPSGIIPYVADPKIPKAIMDHTVREFRSAGIELVPRSNQANYIDLKVVDCVDRDNKGKCDTSVLGQASGLGFKGNGKHTISLLQGNKTSEQAKNLVLHEIGHVLGCVHEHEHPDAAKHVEPTDEGRKAGVAVKALGDNAKTGFDRESIMLYCDLVKSKKSKSSVCDPGRPPTRLSELDRRGILRMYRNEINKRRPAPFAPRDGHYLIYLARGTCSRDGSGFGSGVTGYSIERPYYISGRDIYAINFVNGRLVHTRMVGCGSSKTTPMVTVLGVFEAPLPYRRLAYPDHSLVPVNISVNF